MVGNATFLVSQQNLHSILKDGLLQQAAVVLPVLGIHPHYRGTGVRRASHRGDDGLDIL